MLAVNVFAGETDARGAFLRTSMQQAFARLRSGRPGPLPRPVEDIAAAIDPMAMAMVNEALACSATGSPETVRRELAALIARYAPDEIIITGQIHDHAARLRSFEIAAEAMRAMAPVGAVRPATPVRLRCSRLTSSDVELFRCRAEQRHRVLGVHSQGRTSRRW